MKFSDISRFKTNILYMKEKTYIFDAHMSVKAQGCVGGGWGGLKAGLNGHVR